jgi:hypothetical protein
LHCAPAHTGLPCDGPPRYGPGGRLGERAQAGSPTHTSPTLPGRARWSDRGSRSGVRVAPKGRHTLAQGNALGRGRAPPSGAPEGRDALAQGNALGRGRGASLRSPEGAAYDSPGQRPGPRGGEGAVPVRSPPEGRHTIAQGNALGRLGHAAEKVEMFPVADIAPLRGLWTGRCLVLLPGRCPHPGRCPGLSYIAPSGLPRHP